MKIIKLIGLLYFLSIASIAQNKQILFSGKYISKNESELIFKEENQFELIKKYRFNATEKSRGSIRFSNGKYLLNTYDSIVSEYIYSKIEQLYSKSHSKDSIYVEIISPFTKNIDNKRFKNANRFCENYPLRFVITDDSRKEEYLFASSKFSIAKYSDSEMLTSFLIVIVPDLLCIPVVKITKLWTSSFVVFDSKINHVKISFPDLTKNRFNYYYFENKEITNISIGSFEFMNEEFTKVE